MSFSQLLQILWARRGTVLIAVILAVGATVAVQILMPKRYVATASVVVDSRAVDPVTGATTVSASSATQLATQLDVITSRAVAARAADKLGLQVDAAPGLVRAVTARPSRESNVIQIEFEHSDAVFAARAANAFADAYLDASLELKLDPAKRQSAWYEQQLESLRSNVEARRKSLTEYQQSHGIVATDDRLDVENVRLEEISRQLVEAQRAAKNAGVRLSQADQSGSALQEQPDLQSNALLQSLKSDLTRAESRLAELSQRFDRNHPQYIAVSAEVKSLSDRLSSEMQRARGSLAQSASIANQQVAELQRAFDMQKARLLQMRGQRSEISMQDREVQNAQSAYDAALQRSSQLRLESRLNQTNVAVLDRASTPLGPARLGLGVSMALALVFGAMLGAALALMLERLDRRVRSGMEFLELGGLEVLVDMPRLRPSFRVRNPQLPRRSEALLEGGGT